MGIGRDPAAMPRVRPEVVQLHEFSMIIGKHHVNHAGKHPAPDISVSPWRRAWGTVVVPVNQTQADAMPAAGTITEVAIVEVCRIHRDICFQGEHVVPD